MPSLISLNVGLPQDIEWRGRTVRTAIWKQPVAGRRMIRRLNIDGDGQGDLDGHGGEVRAVMVYQLDSYRYWESRLNRSDFTYGQFGENFTVEGLPDNEVCIGDRYRIGEALFEVTQPRVTCYRVGIRMDNPQMAALLVSHRRPGFYFRVLEEGLAGAGDEIRKVAEGEERMTVAEIDALLYLPGHPRDRLERALRIKALSPGWKSSLQALLEQSTAGVSKSGNAGLTGSPVPPPAWPGFRPLRVSRIDRESATVISASLESPDQTPLPAPLAGQFLVTRLRPDPAKPPVLRNYSLSGAPEAGVYRISVKKEASGIGSNYLHNRVRAGDILETSAPRGNFTLQPGDGPVVLLSAGIGATPMLAMLHALASAASKRAVWWLYGARNREEHPFAEESRRLISSLTGCRSCVVYSRPGSEDLPGRDYDVAGHWSVSLMEKLGVPREADFYLCGPAGFAAMFTEGLQEWGVGAARIHQEIFGPGASITPGILGAARLRAGTLPPASGSGPSVSFSRSGVTVSWDSRFQSVLELAEACGVTVRWSCRTGVCHTCECPLIGGEIDYGPEPVEPPAEGNV